MGPEFHGKGERVAWVKVIYRSKRAKVDTCSLMFWLSSLVGTSRVWGENRISCDSGALAHHQLFQTAPSQLGGHKKSGKERKGCLLLKHHYIKKDYQNSIFIIEWPNTARKLVKWGGPKFGQKRILLSPNFFVFTSLVIISFQKSGCVINLWWCLLCDY